MKRSSIISMLVMASLLLAGAPSAQTQVNPTQVDSVVAQNAMKAFSGTDPKGKDGPMVKVGLDLATLHYEYQSYQDKAHSMAVRQPFKPTNPLIRVGADRVVIDASASGDPDLLRSDLETLGMQSASTFGSIVSGELPVTALGDVAVLKSLQFARPAYATTNAGLVTSQGDAAMRADIARTNSGVDGTGITVGTLSDSFDCLAGWAGDVASGDLPAGIVVLEEISGWFCTGTDEGRAMMQLIHDVAPGANQAFHTAFSGQADFATGITELATVAGADVIVDDVIYFAEPMFQDGIIAQAVDQVKAMGVAYFSSAGNQGWNSYEATFTPSGQFEPLFNGELHDFDGGPAIDAFQSITVPVNAQTIISFQWDQPFFSVSGPPGSNSDLDITILDVTGTNILAQGSSNNLGGDPVEVISFFNDGTYDFDGDGNPDTTFDIGISLFAGPAPSKMKYVRFDRGAVTIDEFDTASPTVYGHANAAGAEAVGAVFYQDTPVFGTSPPLLEPFSSAGGVPILFDLNGNPVSPEFRYKPGSVAPDGTDTTFFFPGVDYESNGFPNFFGTSAAAPHAAAVAALMLDANPSLTPDDIFGALHSTAIDMLAPGFDDDSGFGLIQAEAAVGAVKNDPPVAADDAYTTDEDTSLSILAPGVLANDTDLDGDPLTAVLDVGTGSGALSLNSDGSFDYTPNPGFSGADSFSYQANDGTADGNTATVTITVNPMSPLGDIQSGQPRYIFRGGGAWASKGRIVGLAQGPVDFTVEVLIPPDQGVGTFNSEFLQNGLRVFQVWLDPGIYTLIITAPGYNPLQLNGLVVQTGYDLRIDLIFGGSLPVAADDAYTTDEDTQLMVPAPGVLANDTDADGDPLTAVLDVGPGSGTLTLNQDGSFDYTPNPDFSGTDSFSYHANDGTADGNTATVDITVNAVNDPPILSPIGNQSIDEGSLLSFAATATDADIPANSLTYSLDPGAPAGANIDPVSGVFSWTPTEGQGPGNYPATVRITDDGTPNLSAFETITITVNEVNTAPVLGTIGNQSIDEGSLLSLTATATDADIPANSLTYSLDPGAPAGANIDPVSGVFSWTPTEGQGPGNYPATVRITDDGTPNLSAFETITITVNEVNTAPVLGTIGNQSIDEGSLLSLTATATDADIPANSLTYSLDPGAPAGANIDPVSGVFSWTPTEGQGPGNYPATVRITDDGTPNLSAFETITITVNEVNTAPVLGTIGNQSIDEGSLLSLTATATDADIPANSLSYSLDPGAPAGANIDPMSGVFSWTPTEGQGPGNYPATVRITDDGTPNLSAFETITITVNEVNTAPVLGTIGNQSIDEGSLLSLTATATDADIPANSLSYSLDPGAPAGANIDPMSGVFSWTPTEAQGPGSYAVTIRISDNGTPVLSDAETINITVNEVNDPPLAADDGYTTDEDTSLSVAAPGVLANDTDLDGDPLTALLDVGPGSGTLSLNSDGSFDYTPNPGFSGTDSFSYHANDGTANGNTATVDITVNPMSPLGDIQSGQPQYRFRGGGAWASKGRIVGLAQGPVDFTVEVLIPPDQGVGTFGSEFLQPGLRAYQAFLDPGIYTLIITAPGYNPLQLNGLDVQTGYDLRIDLIFSGP